MGGWKVVIAEDNCPSCGKTTRISGQASRSAPAGHRERSRFCWTEHNARATYTNWLGIGLDKLLFMLGYYYHLTVRLRL